MSQETEMDIAERGFRLVIRRAKAKAWAEGAEYAWQKTGDGHNGENVSGHGTHDGAVSFAEANGDHNPYQED